MLMLAVPIGSDAVVWNAHRIYGRTRLPMLLYGWEVIEAFGHSESHFDAKPGRWDVQPLWVLRPSAESGSNSR